MDAIFIDETRHDPMVEPADWEVMEPVMFVRNLATGLIFQIYPNPARGPDDLLAFSDFFAHLAHICPRHSVPTQETVEELGRQAICMVLFTMGYVTLGDPAGQDA